MSDRNKQKALNLAANASDIEDSVAIPDGKKLVIRKIGLSCQGLGDNSSVFISLRFGTVGSFKDIRSFFCSGSAVELPINKDMIGNGSKFFRVVVKNHSASSARDITWWIEAYDV